MNNRNILEDISKNVDDIYIQVQAAEKIKQDEKDFVEAFKDGCRRELKTYLIYDLRKKKKEIPNVETFIGMIEFYPGDLALYKKNIGEGVQQSRSRDCLDESETKELKEFFKKNNSNNTNNTYADDLAYFSRDDEKSKARDYFLILFKLEKIKDYASFENFANWFNKFSQDENFKPSWLGSNRLGAHVNEIQNDIIPKFNVLKQKKPEPQEKIEPPTHLREGYQKEISNGISNTIQSNIRENNLHLLDNLESQATLESTRRDLISQKKLFAEKKSELATIKKKINDWTSVIKEKKGDLTLADLKAASTLPTVARKLKDELNSDKHFVTFYEDALKIIDEMKLHITKDEVNKRQQENEELESQLKNLENIVSELESQNVSRETSKLYKIVKPFLLKDENITSEQINVFLEKGLPEIISGWNNMSSEEQQKKREKIINELQVVGLNAGKEYLKQNGFNVDAVVAKEKDEQVVQKQPTHSLRHAWLFSPETKKQEEQQQPEKKPYKPTGA